MGNKHARDVKIEEKGVGGVGYSSSRRFAVEFGRCRERVRERERGERESVGFDFEEEKRWERKWKEQNGRKKPPDEATTLRLSSRNFQDFLHLFLHVSISQRIYFSILVYLFHPICFPFLCAWEFYIDRVIVFNF